LKCDISRSHTSLQIRLKIKHVFETINKTAASFTASLPMDNNSMGLAGWVQELNKQFQCGREPGNLLVGK